MATKLVTGTNYLDSWQDGQGDGATNYFNYATDMDLNFIAIQNTVNALVDESRGVSGPNSLLTTDILTLDQVGGDAIGVTTDIVIGTESYFITVSDASNANVTVGRALVGGQRVASTSGFGLVPQASPFSDGGKFWNYVNLDINGAPSISNTFDQATLDLRRIEVNTGGTLFIVAPILIEKVGVWQYGIDGDAWVELSEASNIGGDTFDNELYTEPSIRMNRVERLLSGFNTDLAATEHVAETIGPMVIPGGTAGTPGLVPGNGSGIADLDTGFFTIGANRFGVSTAGNLCLEWDAAGQINLPLNFRVKGRRTAAQTIADGGALVDVVFSAADDFDIGTWHAADADFTVPTDGDGTYVITAAIEWAEAVTNIRDITVEIQLGGTLITGGKSSARLEVGEDHASTVTVVSVLVATNVVTVQVSQDDTVGALGLDVIDATLSIVKVA